MRCISQDLQKYSNYLSLISYVEEIFSSKRQTDPMTLVRLFFYKADTPFVHISTMMKLAVVAALAGSAAAFAPASTGECFVVLVTFKMFFLLSIKLTFNSVILSSILSN